MHINSQTLKQQAQCLDWSASGPRCTWRLLVLYFHRFLWEQMGLWLLCLPFRLVSSCRVAMTNFDMIFSVSLVIFYHVWLLSLRSLLFSNVREKGEENGTGSNWGRTNYIRIHSMRQEPIFKRRGEIVKLHIFLSSSIFFSSAILCRLYRTLWNHAFQWVVTTKMHKFDTGHYYPKIKSDLTLFICMFCSPCGSHAAGGSNKFHSTIKTKGKS